MDGWSNFLKKYFMWHLYKNKNNELFLMGDKTKDILTNAKTLSKEVKPSIVVKTFDNLEAVEKYFEEIRKVDLVIENILKN